MTSPALTIERLSFAYPRSAPALRDVSFSAPAGSFVAVVGPNGAGKSTLLRHAAGLLRPDSGAALLGGSPVHTLHPRARAAKAAYIAQRPQVAGAYTVREIVALGRFALPHDDGAVDRSLRAMALEDRANAPFNHLSAGQQQRAAIARALAQIDPNEADAHARVLLADEPVASLDPVHASTTLQRLRAFTNRGGALVASIHDLSAALRWASHALVLGPGGAPVHFGPVHEALHPDHLHEAFGARFAIGEVAGARIVAHL
ncbi:MAG: ABC transporter ATP-binding protein [Phycisphaerales bacterium]|nr:ABC transporter ATP-binding protein [Phycisphaerales bacterium]